MALTKIDEFCEMISKNSEVATDDNGDTELPSDNNTAKRNDTNNNVGTDEGTNKDTRVETLSEVEQKDTESSQSKPEKVTAVTFQATAYTADCPGCSGLTRYGLDVRNTIYSPAGLRVIAVDPAVIKPMSVVKVTLENGHRFTAVAADIGSAINGREIDILVGTRSKALDFGRQDVKVKVIK